MLTDYYQPPMSLMKRFSEASESAWPHTPPVSTALPFNGTFPWACPACLKANFGPFRRGSSGLVAGLCWAVLGARVEATLTAVWHILGC